MQTLLIQVIPITNDKNKKFSILRKYFYLKLELVGSMGNTSVFYGRTVLFSHYSFPCSH